mgnify:CR=1 FL=1
MLKADPLCSLYDPSDDYVDEDTEEIVFISRVIFMREESRRYFIYIEYDTTLDF